MVNRENHPRIWIAWGITIGEALLLVAFGVVLSQYWLMLPVWMRSGAGFGLGLGFLLVAYRFYKFRRTKPTGEPKSQTAPSAVERIG